jgi:CheY-like chemotaxis protein
MPSRWINDAYESSLPKPKVLSVGTLPELLSLRHAVLEGAGFHVFSTSKPEEALLRIENGNCGVLLLCYSLHDETLRTLATQFRKSCPHGRIVAVTNRPVVIPPIQADGLAPGVEGPEALIAAVRGDQTGR